MQKIVIVHNPASGSALSKQELTDHFMQASLRIETFIDVRDDLQRSLAPYIGKKDVIIVGFGGDGTIRSVAQQLVHTGTVFAPLPGGTLNHFTKDAGVEQELPSAIARLSMPTIVEVDTASVNDTIFLNNSSIGLYPTSLRERSKIEKYLGKWPAALYASILAFVRFNVYTVTYGGKTFHTPFVFVGNNTYDIDSLLSRKHVDRGQLGIYAIDSTKRSSLIKIFIYSVVGLQDRLTELRYYETTDAVVSVHASTVRVSYDGEHARLASPLTYTLHPKSLRIVR